MQFMKYELTDIQLASDEFGAIFRWHGIAHWRRITVIQNTLFVRSASFGSDRRMNSLGFIGMVLLHALLSLFGVHANGIGNTLDKLMR